MANTIGTIFRLSTFGESHGTAMGGIIDGCPAGLEIDFSFIQKELDRRKPGQSSIATPRKENDTVEFLSGIFENKTTGAPIGFIIRNNDQHSSDYDHLKNTYRPSHADYTYDAKYGIRDHRGGGRASVRDTVSWVVAGAIAKLILQKNTIHIQAYVSQVGDVKLLKNYKELDLSRIEDTPVRCPDDLLAKTMINRIEQAKAEGDTLGGVVSCIISGVPAGLGEPVFNKLHADLGKAMLSINAVKGFEYGSGFEGAGMKGSEHNDAFLPILPLAKGEDVSPADRGGGKGVSMQTATNYSGGIQGGISNGEDIYFRVAFKPVSTIMKKQESIDKQGNEIELEGKGRHDPCVVARAVPIVEAMAAMVIVDHWLMNKTSKLE